MYDHIQWWYREVCKYEYHILYVFNNLTGFASEVINLHTANNLIFIIRGSLGDLRGNCGNDSMHSGVALHSFFFLFAAPVFTCALPTLSGNALCDPSMYHSQGTSRMS
jgi:hypothetical protein